MATKDVHVGPQRGVFSASGDTGGSDQLASRGRPLAVSIGLVGPGLIGSALLNQLEQQIPSLLAPLHASSIRLVGLANSRAMLLRPQGLPLGGWRGELAEQGGPLDLDRFIAAVSAGGSSPSSASASTAPADADAAPSPSASAAAASPAPAHCCVLVDCSASDAVASAYPAAMRAGLHIVTPNKKFGAGPLGPYLELRELSQRTGRSFMYEATVGAGLPVLSTLQELLLTGDRVVRIEGVLSGTLSYIFNTYKPGMRFSEVVADARARGFTEPDPRDDLAGLDVARKVVILAREVGLPVELGGMAVQSLVPAELAQGGGAGVREFMERLHEYDGDMAGRAAEAAAAGGVVRYVGCVDVEAGSAEVALRTYPASHPFAQLSGSDNLVVFTTQRYRERPLCVRGPGAGAEVTAAGVFGDLIKVIRSHPRG